MPLLVHLLGMGRQMYCSNRARLVPVLGMGLQMYWSNRAQDDTAFENYERMTL